MSIKSARHHAGNRNWSMAAVEAMPRKLFEAVYIRQSDHDLIPGGYRKPWFLVTADGEEWHLPRPKDALRITHIGDRPRRRVVEKYLRGPITVSKNDKVVDVGAMIGEFARGLPTDNVLAIDPDPRNCLCLRQNITGDVEQKAAWCSNRDKELHLGESSSETSLLDVDGGSEQGNQTVPAKRLDGIVSEPVDLLKVEAEGVEPEVLQGAAGVDARQVVVDVSPERNGQSPAPLCRSLLEDRGYFVERHDDILTAVK